MSVVVRCGKSRGMPAETGVIACILSIIGSGPLLYLLDPDYYFYLTHEDGIVEYLTAFLLLGIVCVFLLKSKSLLSADKPLSAFYLFISLVFLFGVGEEVSWGQRIFGFEVPGSFREINVQGEFTVHNIRLGEIKVNKLIFGTIMYTGIFAYFFIMPFLYRVSERVSTVVERLQLPVPKVYHSLLYLLSFLLLLAIPTGKLWEMQELAFASFILVAFLFPDRPHELT